MRFLSLLLSLIVLTSLIIAQSGRNKTAPDAYPPRPKPETDFPSIRVSDKTGFPLPTPTPLPATAKIDDDGEVLRVESVLIPIPASVLDAGGNVVRDLAAKDFELLVDGAAGEISDVSRSESPVRLALLFDNSSSVTLAREFEKKAATKFLKKVLRPAKDQAALYAVSTVSRREQRLTSDTRQLVQAIEMFPDPAGATALFDAVVSASDYLREAATDGRRVIVIVSDGADTISDATLESAVQSAQIANCQIYVVKTTDFENFKRTGKRGSGANLRDLAAERRMQELTAQTGGAVYSPLDERELDAAFANIAAELSEQYILSYYPTDAKADGKFRQIALRVPAKQNVTVRTRKGYYVPKSSQ